MRECPGAPNISMGNADVELGLTCSAQFVGGAYRSELDSVVKFAITAGTHRDISFLIDFLPSYLFPHGEQTIERWMLAGISLGGHATWHALQHGECSLDLRLEGIKRNSRLQNHA